MLAAPAQRILDPYMKNTDAHSCSISTCLIDATARCLQSTSSSACFPVLPAQHPKSALNFSCSVILILVQHPQPPTCIKSLWSVHPRSHTTDWLFYFQSMAKLFPSSYICLHARIQKSCLFLLASN